MSFSEEIKTTAIVGTAQKELNLSAVGGKLGETLTKLNRADRERFLLSSAAAAASRQTAGKVLSIDRQNAPEIAEAETREILSGQSKQLYETLLNNSDKSLLPEFLDLMRQRRKIIPPELLPLTFALANTHLQVRGNDFRHQILPVVGNRGKWLARQMNRWLWVLVEESSDKIFETGISEERIFALEYLRRKDADKARKLLQKSWNSEAAKDRQRFLEVLETNLSESDAEFLDEIWQSDKSGEVRRTAADLAARLPNSKLIEEMKRRVAEMLLFNKGGFLSKSKLVVNYPNDFDNLDKKDVLNDVQLFLDESSLGKKAGNLVKILSFIQPEFWTKSFSVNHKDILSAAINSDWKGPLIFGFALAAERFSNTEWLMEILNLKLNNKENPFWNRSRMMPNLRNQSKFESIVSELLQNKSNLEFLNFAEENQHQYSPESSAMLVQKLLVWLSLADKNAGNQSTWKLFHFAVKFAASIDHTELTNYLSRLKRQFPSAEDTPKQIEETLDILELRLRIYESFTEE